MTRGIDDGGFPEADAVLRSLHASLTTQIARQSGQPSMRDRPQFLLQSVLSKKKTRDAHFTILFMATPEVIVRSAKVPEIELQDLPRTADEAGVSIVELVAVRLAAAGDLVASLETTGRSDLAVYLECQCSYDDSLRNTSEQLRRLSQHLLLRQVNHVTFGEVLAAAEEVLNDVRVKWIRTATDSPASAPGHRAFGALSEASRLIKEVFSDLPRLFDLSRDDVSVATR